MPYFINQKLWYKKNRDTALERANSIIKKGHNTALIFKKGNNVLAHAYQIRSRQEYVGEMEIKL